MTAGLSVAVVINPASRRSSPRLRDALLAALPAGAAVSVDLTRRGGDARTLARDARERGAELVVVMGGDGTVNEAAGALVDTPVALCPFPAGGTNVFARALGWPRDSMAASRALADALRARPLPTRTVRTWTLHGDGVERLMCFNAGIGIDADTVAWVEARQGVKRRLGHAAFAAGAVLESVRAARDPHVIRIDGVDATFRSVALALGSPYAWWGRRPLDLIPSAGLEGGLHWIGLRTTRVDRVAAVVLGALAGGRHTGLESVAGGMEEARLRLTSAQPVHAQVDGEPLGRHLAVEFRAGGPLRALTPPGA